MAETLATAAAIVGLIVPTLHGIRLLTDDLNNVINAPRVIQRLTDELQSVHLSVACLKEIDEAQWKALGEKVAEQSEKALTTCTKACDEVRGDVQRWTRRSKDGQRSWRERANIGFFKEKRITAMLEQLQSCKISLNTVASTASFHSSIRNFRNTEDLKAQLLARQQEMNEIAVVADGQATCVEQSLGVLRIAQKPEEQPGSQAENPEDLEEDIEGAEMAMEDELLTLKALRGLMEELKTSIALTKVEGNAPPNAGSVQVNFGDHNHGAQFGTNHGPIGGIQIGQRG